MNKGRLFWPLATAVVLADYATKRVAENALHPGAPRPVFGDFLRFTLGYNQGVAFGISVGDNGRILLILFTIIAVAGIVWIYRSTDASQKLQIAALGLIMGGAVGNMLDRFQSSTGVVDFIDVGIGSARFWTFNIADSAITIGAVLLILSSLMAESDKKKARPAS